MKSKAALLKIELCNQIGETSIHIDAHIGESGDLLLSGQDLGEAPRTLWKDDDYEYWLQVPKQEKDRVLLLLLEKLYKGNPNAVGDLWALLDSKGIFCKFSTW